LKEEKNIAVCVCLFLLFELLFLLLLLLFQRKLAFKIREKYCGGVYPPGNIEKLS
jgi:hypothetical protein